jgi:hypothetical protein
LVTTPDHPFAKAGGGWTPAGALVVGDEIQALKGGPARISAIDVRQTEATPVYNLTVAKTHAYFVGQESLLVHNTDCSARRPLSEHLAEERERERERERQTLLYQQQLQRDLREERARKERDRERRRRNRLNVNDAEGPVARVNCTFCALAALDGAVNLSAFLQRSGLDQHNLLSDEEVERELVRLRLSHPGGGLPPRSFTRRGMRAHLHRMFDAHTGPGAPAIGSRYAMLAPAHDALSYMASTSGNTFLLGFTGVTRSEQPPGSGHYQTKELSHAVVAIRKDDGEIVFIDPQNVPPGVYRRLPPTAFFVNVFSTDVDWRYNRQLFAALRDGVVHESF